MSDNFIIGCDHGFHKPQTIVMARGDIFPLTMRVETVDHDRIDFDLDEITFTVKKYYTDAKPKFQKKLSKGDIYYDEDDRYFHFVIEENDTAKLPFGEYVFDIEIRKNNVVSPDIKETTKGEFILTEEGTY